MIAFTYDPNTAIGQVRLLAGDTDPNSLNKTGGDRTRTDAEIAALLAQYGNDIRLAAAALLDSKAAEFAALAIQTNDGTIYQDYRDRSWQMRQSATALRQAAGMPAWNPPAQPAPFSVGEGGTMEDW